MERVNWLDKLIVAAVLILMAVLLTDRAKAEEVMKYSLQTDAAEVALFGSECKQPWVKEFVAAAIPHLSDRFKRAVGNFRHRDGTWKVYEGCWIEFTADEVGAPMIGTIWEDKTRYLTPKEEFGPKGTGV